jgi:hypothetical protein
MTTDTARHRPSPGIAAMLEHHRQRQARRLGDESQLDPERPTDRDALALLAALRTFGDQTRFVHDAEVEARLQSPMDRWAATQGWIHMWNLGLVGLMEFEGRWYVRLADEFDKHAMSVSGELLGVVEL